MLLNLSNHPKDKWDEHQLNTALSLFGKVVDMSFPQIDPHATEKEIELLAERYAAEIFAMQGRDKLTVHVMGEMTFTFALVFRLKRLGIASVASTSERNVEIVSDSEKKVYFSFVRFRYY